MSNRINKRKVILGIDPGARQIGIAIFRIENKGQQGELVYYGIKTIKRESEKETKATLRKILRKLFKKYEVDCVAIERPAYVQQKSSFVREVFSEIKRVSRSKNLALYLQNPQAIRKSLCPDKKPTKENVADVLAKIYPELKRYRCLSRYWQKRYYAMLFDAVAVGLVCVRELENNGAEKRKTNSQNPK